MITHENNLLCFVIMYIRILEEKWTVPWRYVDENFKKQAIQALRDECMDFYSREEVIKARNYLFDFYRWDWFKKKIHTSINVKENHMDDILLLITRVVQSEIPVFVTDNRRIRTPESVQIWLQEQPGDQSPEDLGKAFMTETVIRSMPDIASWCAAPPGFPEQSIANIDHREMEARISQTKTKEKLENWKTENDSVRSFNSREYQSSASDSKAINADMVRQTDNTTNTSANRNSLDIEGTKNGRKRANKSRSTKFTQTTKANTRSIDVHVKPKLGSKLTQTSSVETFVTATQTEQQCESGRDEIELVNDEHSDVSTDESETSKMRYNDAIDNVANGIEELDTRMNVKNGCQPREFVPTELHTTQASEETPGEAERPQQSPNHTRACNIS